MLLLLFTACLYDRERFLELSDGFVDNDKDGYREIDGDCRDRNPEVNPGVIEICDGIDNDCNEGADELDAADITVWYQDQDQDGYGSDALSKLSCQQPYLFTVEGGDCNDDNSAFYPGAPEVCEQMVDNNCDGITPGDHDGDGYACDDCDDNNPDIHPNAPELCNDDDDNCDIYIDNDATDTPTWYKDRDGDGYGDSTISAAVCDQPPNYVLDNGDCDDTTADAAPGLSEVCNDGLDTNCDGSPGECGSSGELSTTATLTGLVENGRLGSHIAPLGDINEDGFDDLVVGAPYADVKVHTVVGPFSGEIPVNLVSAMQMEGEQTLGYWVAGAGDQTGDGWPDVLASSWNSGTSGTVYLFSGYSWGRYQQESSTLAEISGSEVGSFTGFGIWGDFDWNGDGVPDIAVGAPAGTLTEVGILSGPLAGDYNIQQDANVRILSDQGQDGLGSGWVTEDLDGNGQMDVVVSAPAYLRDSIANGVVCVFRDVQTGTLQLSDADTQWWGEGESYMGDSLAVADDQDGDGSPDLWVGAGDNLGGDSTSTLRRISSNSPSGLVADHSLVTVLGGYGGSRLLAADLNLDGSSDLVLGNLESGGNLFLFYGPLLGTVDTTAADAWYTGEHGIGYYNPTLAGDTDGDGNLEIGAGAEVENSYTGAVVLLEVEVW